MAPSVRKRGFANADLIANWPELVGERFATCTQPDSIRWPRAQQWDSNEDTRPATLLVRCDGPQAVFLQHEVGQLRDRINIYFGFAAIGAIKIIQKPLDQKREPPPNPPAPLTGDQEQRLASMISGLEKSDLRLAVERLGRAIFARKNSK